MQVCESAGSLKEVYANSLRLEKESKHFFDKGQFYLLSNYFEKILPQLESREWATTLPLVEGVNLMDLEDMTFEMQCLVIERVMDHALTNMKNVIIVLPEARKFIPLSAKTPVTKTAVKIASEGAVLEVDLWVDSQTYSSINSEVRKQCGTQLHGVQMDNNEAKTITDLLDKKWKPRKLKSLKLGHFFVKTKDKRYKHVYVLPAGIEEDVGIAVATGKLRVEEVKSMLMDIVPLEVVPDNVVKEDELLEAEGIVERNKGAVVKILAKLRTELGEANRKLLEQEEELHLAKVKLHETVEKLEAKAQGLQDEVDELSLKAEQIVAQNKELEIDKAQSMETVEQLMETMERQERELSQFTAFKILLAGIIGPQLEFPQAVSDEELEKIRKDIADLKKPVATRHRRISTEGDTGIAWVDIWLLKLGGAEEKILRFMASKYPMKMTKSEVAIGIGLTAKGGYFSAGFNKLRKNKLIIPEGNDWKLAEGPPG
uniref:Uncharacterized protein n=2 Tax=viral metagenome TaxID=1070528 RepID=A0A6M3M1L4_9ZZZZ